MLDTERELQKLGVPVKTRHNEVAPNQYELAPIFENSNVGADHQQLTMQIMQNVARRYGLVCLLHEKPFAGVNGSGKHNNWSMGTDGGENLLEPGDTPHENLQFLFFCAAVIQAVNKHQGLLRASIASPGQDHRLGRQRGAAGDHLDLPRLRAGEGVQRDRARRGGRVHARSRSWASGRRCCRRCRMHGGDRNRTSPFAFTGNKFEFRALGSSMSLSLPNTVLNTIVAEADRLPGRGARGRAGGRRRAGGRAAADPAAQLRGQQADRVRRRQLLRGVARRGRVARAAEPAGHPRRAALPASTDDTVTRVLQLRRPLPARAGEPLRGVRWSSTSPSSTSRPRPPRRSPRRCCCRRRRATWRCCSAPRWASWPPRPRR